MKYAVFTVMTPEWDLAETAQNLAALGYDGVEWRVQTPPSEEWKRRLAGAPVGDVRYWLDNRATIDPAHILEQAPEIKQITEGAGLAFCSLATYLPVGQPDAIERVMQAAAAMGCPSLRVNAPEYNRSRNVNDLFAETAEHLARVAALAKQYGVQANVETHMGNIIPSASAAYRLVSSFDPEWIGVIFDPGNMMYEGYECWRMGFELLGPYLHEVHAKNAVWEQVPAPEGAPDDGTLYWRPHYSAMRTGFASWKQIMADLKAVGYDGWIAFEDFSDDEGTTAQKCARNLAYLKGYE